MSISSDPAAFLRRARKIGCPEAAIGTFLALRPAKGMICTVNGNSRFAIQGDVASFYEADNMPGYDFPASIYDVDALVRITGHLKVGGDTLTRQVNKLCPWALVKLLADRLPTAVVDECFDQAVRAAVKGEDIDPGDELKARTEASIDQLSPLITQVRRGSVRFIGTCTAVHG